jgi:hypothetical protein
LVPPKPKELTLARRGVGPWWGHGTAVVLMVKGLPSVPSRVMPAAGARKVGVGGMRPWDTLSTALITPAMPAAALRCPIVDLTEPR